LSKLGTNIIANYVGSAWSVLMSVAFVPLYIRFIGIESYGLIGFFSSLQAFIYLLDFGLATTINREMAASAAAQKTDQESRNILRTLEVVYWLAAVGIGIILATVGPLLATHWVNPQGLSRATIAHAALILALVVALRWPSSLYAGALAGRQRMVLLNVLNASLATVRGAGAVLVLWLVSSTVEAFLVWQVAISIAQTAATGFFIWKDLPPTTERTRFEANIIKRIWKFSAGMTGISVTVLLLTQTDKLVLSKTLSLTDFGYYTLASTVGSMVMITVSPVVAAVFPKLSGLLVEGNEQGLRTSYHLSCQLVSVACTPLAAVIALFSHELLLVWTRDLIIAEKAYLVTSLLTIGSFLNGVMNVPYYLQLAYGWTSLALYINIVATIVLIPLLIVLVQTFGAVGGGIAWIILNGGYVIFGINLMHRRILPGDKWRWYAYDVGLPAGAAVASAGLMKFLEPPGLSALATCLWLLATVALSAASALLVVPDLRRALVRQVESIIISSSGPLSEKFRMKPRK
jgi:O-antigen/teichoic acid export membrane protein